MNLAMAQHGSAVSNWMAWFIDTTLCDFVKGCLKIKCLFCTFSFLVNLIIIILSKKHTYFYIYIYYIYMYTLVIKHSRKIHQYKKSHDTFHSQVTSHCQVWLPDRKLAWTSHLENIYPIFINFQLHDPNFSHPNRHIPHHNPGQSETMTICCEHRSRCRQNLRIWRPKWQKTRLDQYSFAPAAPWSICKSTT